VFIIAFEMGERNGWCFFLSYLPW